VNGIVAGTLSPLLAGGRVTVAGRFSLKEFWSRVEQSRATYFSAVPTIYTMLANLPAEVTPDTSSVRFAVCGAAPASVELLNKFESRYGIPIIEGYGLSEGSCASTLNPLNGPRKPGTVGLPFPGQTIRIVDANGNPVADGESGEVLIQGPNVMRGYLNRPEETAKTLVDGWLHTGDIGRFDADGYLYLLDRRHDVIISGGFNVYPREVEDALLAHPAVVEAAVVGLPDAKWGERVTAAVVLRAPADPEQIRDFCARRLAGFKRPKSVEIWPDLPTSPVGKSLRREVRDRMLARKDS
jgi:acyl-CoA synthetase (AMP-forming)/AMP-acid ligase II